MDKELQQALAAILNKTSGAIESGVVFLQGQLPEVIHQLLMWKAIESGIVLSPFWLCFLFQQSLPSARGNGLKRWMVLKSLSHFLFYSCSLHLCRFLSTWPGYKLSWPQKYI